MRRNGVCLEGSDISRKGYAVRGMSKAKGSGEMSEKKISMFACDLCGFESREPFKQSLKTEFLVSQHWPEGPAEHIHLKDLCGPCDKHVQLVLERALKEIRDKDRAP